MQASVGKTQLGKRSPPWALQAWRELASCGQGRPGCAPPGPWRQDVNDTTNATERQAQRMGRARGTQPASRRRAWPWPAGEARRNRKALGPGPPRETPPVPLAGCQRWPGRRRARGEMRPGRDGGRRTAQGAAGTESATAVARRCGQAGRPARVGGLGFNPAYLVVAGAVWWIMRCGVAGDMVRALPARGRPPEQARQCARYHKAAIPAYPSPIYQLSGSVHGLSLSGPVPSYPGLFASYPGPIHQLSRVCP